METVKQILQRFCAFLSAEQLQSILKERDELNLKTFIDISLDVLQFQPRTDNLLKAAEQKLQRCEALIQTLIDEKIQFDSELADKMRAECQFLLY